MGVNVKTTTDSSPSPGNNFAHVRVTASCDTCNRPSDVVVERGWRRKSVDDRRASMAGMRHSALAEAERKVHALGWRRDAGDGLDGR